MKRLGVCFLVWLVVGLGAGWADEASHRQAVEALFDQLGMEAVMNATVSQMAAAITGRFRKTWAITMWWMPS